MAVAERFRMWTPAGRDDGQDGLPRGFVTVGIWGLFVCERFVRFCSSGTDTASVRSNWRAAHGLRSGVQQQRQCLGCDSWHRGKVFFSGDLLFPRHRLSSCGLDSLFDLNIHQAVVQLSDRVLVPDFTRAEGRDNGWALHTSG